MLAMVMVDGRLAMEIEGASSRSIGKVQRQAKVATTSSMITEMASS
jgi:hypothetical protein